VSDRPRPCFFCGYDLADIPQSATCPECGKPALDAGQVLDYRAIAGRRARWIVVFATATVAIGLLLLVVFAVVFEPFP
jgi:hypothetical protein